MSLEQELARNTEAMIALTAALTAGTVVVEAPIEAPVKEATPPKLVVVVPVETMPSMPTVTSAFTTSVTTPVSGTKTATPTIEYAQVAKAITDTFKVDRVKVIQALAKFNAAKGPQLKPEDYAAFLAELAA